MHERFDSFHVPSFAKPYKDRIANTDIILFKRTCKRALGRFSNLCSISDWLIDLVVDWSDWLIENCHKENRISYQWMKKLEKQWQKIQTNWILLDTLNIISVIDSDWIMRSANKNHLSIEKWIITDVIRNWTVVNGDCDYWETCRSGT